MDGSPRPLELRLSVPPRHNLLNATAALAVAHALGLPLEDAATAIGTYGGVHRRFERKGEAAGARFVDDYAIHPTEVASVVGAARSEGGRVVAVFQPHRYSRTSAMWRELGESLAAADVVVVTDVYAAWEEPIPGVTGKLVVDALAEAAPGKRIVYLPRRADVGPFLASFARDGDRVVTLGAGDITMVADETLALLRERTG
jgi:UDP-N-acetylmuramate--alanine ligase